MKLVTFILTSLLSQAVFAGTPGPEEVLSSILNQNGIQHVGPVYVRESYNPLTHASEFLNNLTDVNEMKSHSIHLYVAQFITSNGNLELMNNCQLIINDKSKKAGLSECTSALRKALVIGF